MSLNKTTLNGSVIGAGASVPWVLAAGAQVFRVVYALTPTIFKVGKAAQSLKLIASFTGGNRVFFTGAAVFAFVGSLPARSLAVVRGVTNTVFRLSSAVYPRRHVHIPVAETFSLGGVSTGVVHTNVYVGCSGTFSLRGVCSGDDIYTGDAPDERVTGAVDLRTRTVDIVTLGA